MGDLREPAMPRTSQPIATARAAMESPLSLNPSKIACPTTA